MPGSNMQACPCWAAVASAPAAASCQARPCQAAATSAPVAASCRARGSGLARAWLRRHMLLRLHHAKLAHAWLRRHRPWRPAAASRQTRPCLAVAASAPLAASCQAPLCQAAVASAPADELCQALAAACVQWHMPLWPHHVGLAHARLWWPMLCSPTLQGPQALQGFFIPSSLMCPRGVGGSLAAATDDDRSRALFRDGMDPISTISSRNDMAVDSTLHSLPNPEVNPTQPRA